MRCRIRTVLAAGLLALLAVGCSARVGTHVVVVAPDDARVRAEVVFEGDAAVAVARDGNLQALVDTFAARTGVTPDVVRRDGTVGVAASLDYQQLTGVADVTGVASLGLAPVGDGTTRLTAEFVDPSDLADAVADAVADDTSGATWAALAGSTRLVTVVEMPGGIVQAQVGGDLPVEVGDTVVTVDQRLDRFETGRLVVHGTPGEPGGLPWLPIGVVAVAVVAGGTVAARARSSA